LLKWLLLSPLFCLIFVVYCCIICVMEKIEEEGHSHWS